MLPIYLPLWPFIHLISSIHPHLFVQLSNKLVKLMNFRFIELKWNHHNFGILYSYLYVNMIIFLRFFFHGNIYLLNFFLCVFCCTFIGFIIYFIFIFILNFYSIIMMFHTMNDNNLFTFNLRGKNYIFIFINSDVFLLINFQTKGRARIKNKFFFCWKWKWFVCLSVSLVNLQCNNMFKRDLCSTVFLFF